MTIVAIDTETTSLRPDRRAWDVGLIIRRDDGQDTEHQWFITADDLDLGNADPFSLRVGRFYDRHPEFNNAAGAHSEEQVLRRIERLTRGAHLIGALPSFDAEVLGARMRAHGILASWYYHVIDIEPLAIGYLHGAGRGGDWSLPYKSDELSRAVGVEPPSDEDRHTALGDARWCLRLFDAITGGEGN